VGLDVAFRHDRGSDSPAVGSDGVVYWCAYDGTLYALDGYTGARRWAFTPENGVQVRASPAIGDDGTVYVGTSEGRLYALASSSVCGLARSPWPKFRGDAQNSGRQHTFSPGLVSCPARGVWRAGQAGTLRVSADGFPAPTFQWLFNGMAIPGATNATLTIPSPTAEHEGTFAVVAANPVGQTNSPPIRVLISNVDPDVLPGVVVHGPAGAAVEVQVRETLETSTPWVTFTNLLLAADGRASVLLDHRTSTQRYFRSTRPEPLGIAWCNAWTYHEPAGSRHRIEYVEGEEWTDWQVLADLTLPTSPHLFIDYGSAGRPPRQYRTTPLP